MENVKGGMWENFLRKHHNLKSLFQRNNSSYGDDDDNNHHRSTYSSKLIPQLSLCANSVISRCSQILQVSTDELQHSFDSELPIGVKELFTYARNLVEFCSYKALQKVSTSSDYLSDKEFCRLTYDMMLAWEAPSVESDSSQNPHDMASYNKHENGDEDDGSLFYSSSTSMALQVDNGKTVGLEAFARIAPVCPPIADIITVHNLFNALTSSSGHRLHFLAYDKYIRSLDKVIKNLKSVMTSSIGNLQLAKDEIIIDIDGIIPTQPILQHIGISTWPGRLTLTNYALYFESLGVGAYEKAVRYDLAIDIKQVIKPDLIGPLGARLFDRAMMYKSTSITEPIYFEFPEFKVNSRRGYWLDICLEILRAHKFIRKYNFKETQKSEATARAILGIFRYHAVRDAFKFSPSHYKTLLVFNLVESLPRGDMILQALSSKLINLAPIASKSDILGIANTKKHLVESPTFVLALTHLGLLEKMTDISYEMVIVGDVRVGEISQLEITVKKSIMDTGKAEAAQATVDQVKVEGIDTNIAVMKELLFPIIEVANHIHLLASWKHIYRSTTFLILTCYMILRGCVGYVLPSIFVSIAAFMLWHKHFKKGSPLEAFKVTSPPNRNAIEQLVTLQETITRIKSLIQVGNITLLKIRALLLALLPKATKKVALLLAFIAAVFAFVPPRYIILVIFIEFFTRQMPYRKDSSDRWERRIREWWFRIPAAPLQLIKADDNKKTK